MCRLICNLPELSIRIFLPHSLCSNKTNVPADLHELLSAAKNLPELSIRNQRSAKLISIRYAAGALL